MRDNDADFETVAPHFAAVPIAVAIANDCTLPKPALGRVQR
jgi:hypothetical protein